MTCKPFLDLSKASAGHSFLLGEAVALTPEEPWIRGPEIEAENPETGEPMRESLQSYTGGDEG